MRSTPSKSPTPPPSSTTEDVWRGRVAAWQRSGQAAVVWCTDKPFAASTLRVWASRLRRADAPAFLELSPREWAATRARLDPTELAAEYGPLTVPPKRTAEEQTTSG